MTILLTAFYQRFVDAGGSLKEQVHGLWPGVAPQGTAFPYMTYFMPSSTEDATMHTNGSGGTYLEEPLVQLSIWDDSPNPDRVRVLAPLAVALWRDQLLTLVGGTTVRADKVNERELRDQDDKGWQYAIDFRYIFEVVRT